MAKAAFPPQAGANKSGVLDKLPNATAGLQPIKWDELAVEQRALSDYDTALGIDGLDGGVA